jgi:hypothetical protein
MRTPLTGQAHGGGSVSIRNGLPADTTSVAYTTAFVVSSSLLRKRAGDGAQTGKEPFMNKVDASSR